MSQRTTLNAARERGRKATRDPCRGYRCQWESLTIEMPSTALHKAKKQNTMPGPATTAFPTGPAQPSRPVLLSCRTRFSRQPRWLFRSSNGNDAFGQQQYQDTKTPNQHLSMTCAQPTPCASPCLTTTQTHSTYPGLPNLDLARWTQCNAGRLWACTVSYRDRRTGGSSTDPDTSL